MKRPQFRRYSVAALALMAMLGSTGCPQDAKEEPKAATPEVAAVPAAPAATPTTDPAAPPSQAGAVVASPTPAPAPGEATKQDPGKAAAVAATNETKEPVAKKAPQ